MKNSDCLIDVMPRHNYSKVDEENFGQTVSIELRPGGKETRVTDENKDEYIQVSF